MGIGVINMRSVEPRSQTVRIEVIVGVADIVAALEQDRAAVGIADLFGGGFNALWVSDVHAGQDLRLRDIGRDHSRQREQTGLQGAMLDLGKGRGPMQHNFNLTGEYAKEAEQ